MHLDKQSAAVFLGPSLYTTVKSKFCNLSAQRINRGLTQSGDDDEDDTVRSKADGMGETPIYQMNEQNRQNIIKLQKHCPGFKYMYRFLKDGILSEDPDKAKSIPYESNTYVLLNDILYHIWTTKVRKKNRESDIVLIYVDVLISVVLIKCPSTILKIRLEMEEGAFLFS
jgi:hypothetical protein